MFERVVFCIFKIMWEILIVCSDSHKALKCTYCIYVTFKYYVLSCSFITYSYNYNRSQWEIMNLYMAATHIFCLPGVDLLHKSKYLGLLVLHKYATFIQLSLNKAWIHFEHKVKWAFYFSSTFFSTSTVHLTIVYQREISTFL